MEDRSARTNRLLMPSLRSVYRRGVACRIFPVAGRGPIIWNSLPYNVISAPSMLTFRQPPITFSFSVSFCDIVIEPLAYFPTVCGS